MKRRIVTALSLACPRLVPRLFSSCGPSQFVSGRDEEYLLTVESEEPPNPCKVVEAALQVQDRGRGLE